MDSKCECGLKSNNHPDVPCDYCLSLQDVGPVLTLFKASFGWGYRWTSVDGVVISTGKGYLSPWEASVAAKQDNE